MSSHIKIINATKWSIITEFIVKFISPLSSMILARLLSPNEFGVVATVVMIVSLADIFTEAGFQRYIISHLFKDKKDEEDSICVAFWTNFGISLFFWLIIFLFADDIAKIVGNSDRGNAIWIGALILPLTSFSRIQMAIFKKRLNFKEISYVRILIKLVPLIIVAPLAYFGFSFWSLIIGNIVSEIISAIILNLKSPWKPKFFYSLSKLKEMISFCMWSTSEAFSSWLISNLGIFIIGMRFNEYYLGVYKIATTTVNQIISIVTAATISVLISALSNVQNNKEEYIKIYFAFLKGVGIVTIPLGAVILLWDKLICDILLGNQWNDAVTVIGIWGFILSESVIFNSMSSAVIISKGKPRELFLSNISQAILMLPAFYFGTKFGFKKMIIITSIVRIELCIIQTMIACRLSGIDIFKIFKVIKKYIISTIVMSILALVLPFRKESLILQILSILICGVVYLLVLFFLPDGRKELKRYIAFIERKI